MDDLTMKLAEALQKTLKHVIAGQGGSALKAFGQLAKAHNVLEQTLAAYDSALAREAEETKRAIAVMDEDGMA